MVEFIDLKRPFWLGEWGLIKGGGDEGRGIFKGSAAR